MNRNQLEKYRTYFQNKFDPYDDDQISIYPMESFELESGLEPSSFIRISQAYLNEYKQCFVEFEVVSRLSQRTRHNFIMYNYFMKFMYFDSLLRNYTYEKIDRSYINDAIAYSIPGSIKYRLTSITNSQQMINQV